MWTQRPSAEDLLQARVRSGWQPTPSQLRSGPAVLGYACSLRRTGP